MAGGWCSFCPTSICPKAAAAKMPRKRILHPEEQELWRVVARTANPLHAQKANLAPSAPTSPEPPKLTAPKPPMADTSRLRGVKLGAAAKMSSAAQFAPNIGQNLANAPLRMDAKTHGKMTRGKLLPEARIDLHGMTLDQAQPALISFILRTHSAGLRLVLVITGKGGKTRADHGPIPQRTGVLRAQVPHWLHQAPLAPLILQVTEAHASHGGGGALYVYLSRR